MAAKQWTRASRVSVSVQVDTLENTAKQVCYMHVQLHVPVIFEKGKQFNRLFYSILFSAAFTTCMAHNFRYKRMRVVTLR